MPPGLDITVNVKSNYQDVIGNSKKTAALVTQDMKGIAAQADALIRKGAPPAQVRAAVTAARETVRTNVTTAAADAGLNPSQRRNREADFARIEDRQLRRLEGMLQHYEEQGRQAQRSAASGRRAEAATRESEAAQRRKASADKQAADAAQREARTRQAKIGVAGAGAARGMTDLLAQGREQADANARRRAARAARQGVFDQLAADEGITRTDARRYVQQGEQALQAYTKGVKQAAGETLGGLAGQLEREYGIIIPENVSGRRGRKQQVYWDDEDTRMALGLGLADPAAGKRGRYQLPKEMQAFFELIDRPSTTGKLGVDPTDPDQVKRATKFDTMVANVGRAGTGLAGEVDDTSGALARLRTLLDEVVRQRGVKKAGVGGPIDDPLISYLQDARTRGGGGAYEVGKARLQFARDFEAQADVEQFRAEGSPARSQAAREARDAADREAKAAQAAIAPFTKKTFAELTALQRGEARQQRATRAAAAAPGGEPAAKAAREAERAAARAAAEEDRKKAREAKEAAAAINAMETEVEQITTSLGRMGIETRDLATKFGFGGGGGGPGGPPPRPPGGGDDDDWVERLRRYLEALQRRLSEGKGSGAIPPDSIVTEFGQAAGDPSTFFAEQTRRQAYLEAQTLRQNRGQENIFDLRALEEGISRGFGLRFGRSYEEAFRQRDLSGARDSPIAGRLFAGGNFGPQLLRSLGIDPDSDLGQRTMKDILVREREAREEIIDQLARQKNVEEREQRAYVAALKRLTNATQDTANQRAARELRGPGGRSLLDVESESRVEQERTKAQQQIADTENRRRLGVDQVLGQQATIARIEAQQQRAMVARRLESNQDYISAQAITIASERRLQAAINQQAAQLLRDEPGIGGSGTRFQRTQAALASRTGGSPRLASEYQGFGQFVQSRFLTTAGFALSGAATYFAQAQIREIIREATELQTEFRIIEGVLQSTGETGDEAFEKIRGGILDVSKATATSADVVARVQRQLAGAFADPETLTPNFDRARVESESAFQLSRITGLPEKEITDSLTAVTLAFERTGVGQTFEQTGDLLLGLGQQFGATETEIVRFTADLAPLAAELGISARELATFGAAMQASSGMGGAALAEQFGRILPGLQSRASEVIQLFESTGSAAELGAAFGANDLSQVLRILMEDYDELGETQQNQLASLVGTRREAGTFFNLLASGDAILASLAGNTDDYAGTQETRFAAVADSVKFAMDSLERSVEELGIALFEAGLADALTALADVGSILVTVLGAVLEVFGGINELAGGMPAKIIGLALAFETLRRAATFGGGILTAARTGQGPGGTAAAPAGAAALSQALVGLGGGGAFAVDRQGVAIRQQAAAQQRAAAAERTRLQRLRQSPALRTTGILALGLGLSAGASALGQGTLSNVLQGAGMGTALGASFGPWGALAGGVGGGLLSLFQQRNQERQSREANRQRAARGEGPNAFEDAIRQLRLGERRTETARGSREKDLDEILEKMREGADLSDDELALIDSIVQEQIALGNQDFIEAGQSPADRIIAERQEAAARRQLNFSEAINKYEAGIGSQSEVLQAFGDEIDAVNAQIEGAVGAGNDTTDLELEVLDLLQQRAQFLAESINARFDRLDQTAEAFGGRGASREADLTRAQSRLSALQDVGADPAAITEAAFAVVAAQRAMLDAQIAGAETTAEQLAIANRGLAVDADAAAAIAEAGLREAVGAGLGERFMALMRRINASMEETFHAVTRELLSAATFSDIAASATAAGTNPTEAVFEYDQAVNDMMRNVGLDDEDLQDMIDLVVATGQAETEAVRALQNALIDRVKRIFEIIRLGQITLENYQIGTELPKLLGMLSEIGQLITEVESYGAAPEKIQGDTQGIEDQKAKEKEEDNLAQRIAEARLAVRRAQANGDPAILAQLAVESARLQIQFAKDEAERLQGLAALIEAGNEQRRAYIDIQDSLLELASSRSNDPLTQASYAVQLAQRAINFAQGEAARNRALAQKAEADRSYRDAIVDIANSRVELVMAMARAAGDDVAAAESALELTQIALARARNEQQGEAAINRAQADVIEAQAALRDAQLASRRADIEFALDMGKATVAQAISQLQALLQIPGLTEQQTREILLRIKQLRDQLNSELSFNLPSDLRLPTLYEARRLTQATQAGQNYQSAQVNNNDNRIISIELNSTDPASTEAAVGQIVDAVNAPPREGTYAGILN